MYRVAKTWQSNMAQEGIMTTDEKVAEIAAAMLRVCEVLDGTRTGQPMVTDFHGQQDLDYAKQRLGEVLDNSPR